jgi:hypothetical protein
MKRTNMHMRDIIAWTYLMLYLVVLAIALSQIASLPSIVAMAMIPSLGVGLFGVLIAFWVSSDEVSIKELKDYLGPSIKEKEDMLERLNAERENADKNDGSIVVKEVVPPQQKIESQ